MAEDFIAALEQVLSPERVTSDSEQLARFERDLVSPMTVRPFAAVTPVSEQEVIDTVRLCYERGVPFLARGAGSSLSGGALPVAEGIIISLKDLNRIRRIDPVSRVAVVEPGVINQHVSNAAAEHNLCYAPDPSSQAFCTIGGNVAFNSGGAHCLKYGMTANHVLGIKAVLGDGRIVRLGGESLESVGPDLAGLFVGSEGLFGIALEITLRLVPVVEAYRTVLASYDTLEAAGNAVAAIVASGLLPGALEIMDPLAIRVCEEASHAGYPQDAGALLIAELEGEAEQVEAEFAVLEEIVRRSGAGEVRIAESDEQRAAIWKGRKVAFTAVRKISPRYIVQDGVVPRGRLGEALAEIERLSKAYEIPVANVFHAGDGNLHPLILYDAAESPSFEHAEQLAGEILRMCIGMGGSITGEHGVGLEKRDYLGQMYGEVEMDSMRRLRAAMDPKGIANRGKMLAEAAGGGGAARVGAASDGGAAAGAAMGRAADDPAPDGPGAGDSDAAGPPSGGRVRPSTVEEVQQAVRSAQVVSVAGAGTKPGLALPVPAGAKATVLDMRGLSDVLQYDPEEFTFTALAGTPVSEVASMLAEHGQYLPFDPLLVDAGATLGGTVAAGLSGPGRYRFGGVRDFILGTRFVDGAGQLIRGGSRVVKNAAGFDYPKLMVGSLGSLGVLVDLTFKVFPRPPAATTISFTYPDIDRACAAASAIACSSLDVDAIEIDPGDDAVSVIVRIAGFAEQLPSRVQRVNELAQERGFAGESGSAEYGEEYWRRRRELEWVPSGAMLLKVPVTLAAVPRLHAAVGEVAGELHYSVAGNAAWIALPGGGEGPASDAASADVGGEGAAGEAAAGGASGGRAPSGGRHDRQSALNLVERRLGELELSGLVVWPEAGGESRGAGPLLGAKPDRTFRGRVKEVLDPNRRFPAL